MKKIIFSAILLFIMSLGTSVLAADVLKIQQNGQVKRAKEIGSGNGIVFTLPDLNNPDFIIDSVELAMFEKKPSDVNYKIFGSTKLVENPTSLNITFDFGDTAKYAQGSKYKIGYRYYVRSVDDASILEIAGQESKDGWRLVGEDNPIVATVNGFSFYLNSAPNISLINVSWKGEDITSAKTFTYTPVQLQDAFLHKNALSDGITVNYSLTEPDEEDTLTIYYKLINKVSGAVIVESVLGSDGKISSSTTAEYVDLVLYVVDNWGERAETSPVALQIDWQSPLVVNQFDDLGRGIRGKELYSKFTVTDDNNVPLSSGNVHYSIKRNGVTIVDTTRWNNNAYGEYVANLANQEDGDYEIILTMFDKAYNKTIHTLNLTLDNTPPTLRFVPQSEDERATLYNSWVNLNKNVVIEVLDNSGVKKVSCVQNGAEIFSGSGVGIKVFPVPNKTGRLALALTVEDTACTVDKTNNMANTASQGNVSTFGNNVWIDKTPPSVSINADENTWYAPFTVTVDYYDYESAVGMGDNSAVSMVHYQIGDTITENWLVYGNGVEFNSSGIYYLHIRATDSAGNANIVSKRIKISSPLTIGTVAPTADYLHTIYNSIGDIYIIKNTAFNTKFSFVAQDNDTMDTIKADVKLISQDDSNIFGVSTVHVPPNGSVSRAVDFNMSYLKSDGTALPDGVYSMELTVSQIKSDGYILTVYSNVKVCEVVIKRMNPPKPEIKFDSGEVSVVYPAEVLSGSLNRAYIRNLYEREYKIVKDGQADSNIYTTYSNAITAIDYDCNVTAIHTDPAGNVATATLRVFGSVNSGGGGGTASIQRSGNSVRLEEGRPANFYYIGTRRDKNAGIDNDVFKFLN